MSHTTVTRPFTCPVCDRGVISPEDAAIEWRDRADDAVMSLRTGDVPLIASRFDLEARCTICGEPQSVGSGTGYWSQAGWDGEADAEVMVYDGEVDADGRAVAHATLALGQWRQVGNRIVPF